MKIVEDVERGDFSLPNPVWNKVLWGIGALTALLTAVYIHE